MKKAVKVCLISSAVLISLGIGVSVSAFAMGATLNPMYGRRILNYAENYSLSNNVRPSEGHELSGYEISDGNFDGEQSDFYDIKNLELEVDEGLIEIIESDDADAGNKITVKYEAPKARVSLRQSGDTLIVESKLRYRNFGIGHKSSSIIIIVPKDYQFYDVDIEAGAAQVEADFLYADNVDIHAGVGSIKIGNGRIGELEMSGGVGSLLYEGAVDRELSINGGVGSMDIKLTGSELDFNYEISSGVGSVKVGESQYSGLASEKKINNNADKTMEIDCGVGSITVQFHEEDV